MEQSTSFSRDEPRPRVKAAKRTNSTALKNLKKALERVKANDEVDADTGELVGLFEAVAAYNQAIGRNDGGFPDEQELVTDDGMEMLEATKFDNLGTIIFGLLLEDYSKLNPKLRQHPSLEPALVLVRDSQLQHQRACDEVNQLAAAAKLATDLRKAKSGGISEVKEANKKRDAAKTRASESLARAEAAKREFQDCVDRDPSWKCVVKSSLERGLGSFYESMHSHLDTAKYVQSVASSLACVILDSLQPCMKHYADEDFVVISPSTAPYAIFIAVLELGEKLVVQAVPNSSKAVTQSLLRLRADTTDAIHHIRLISALSETQTRTNSPLPLNESLCGPAIHPLIPTYPFFTIYDLPHSTKNLVKHVEDHGIESYFPAGILHKVSDLYPSVLSPTFHNRNPQDVKNLL
ncbi:hypothetical protein HDU98_008487 [Podochytrium sp. JEL0797]|nr:hypothetical protein HDU98_008487 [Podochytrium sp. JEL0797]